MVFVINTACNLFRETTGIKLISAHWKTRLVLIIRLMDAFIDKPDLQKLAFTGTVHKSEGRPPCAPGMLLKLYLYGYLNKVHSSQKLEKECSRNIDSSGSCRGCSKISYPDSYRISVKLVD